MNLSNYLTSEERVFDDLQKVYHVNNYVVVFSTLGAFDEDGNENIGYGAEISISLINGKNNPIFKRIREILENACEYVNEYCEAIYNSCIEEVFSVYGVDYSTPDSAENTLKTVIKYLEVC